MMDKFSAQRIQTAWSNARNKKRNCSFPGCTQTAIKSHVLQKNGVLNLIAVDNHLIQLDEPNPFHAMEGKMQRPKRVGLNNVYTFPGFCNEHDTKIFAPIEVQANLDVYAAKTQALFSYRALCQEVYRKQTAVETLRSSVSFYPPHMRPAVLELIDGNSWGIGSLTEFKTSLEQAIITDKYDQLTFTTVEIPRIDVCISVPIDVSKAEPPPDSYEEYVANRPKIIPTSYLNIFPSNNCSYLIAGYHNEYPSDWIDSFIIKMKSTDRKKIFKEISDLLTLRLEFWAMSPSLFASIPSQKIEEYKRVYTEHMFDFDDTTTTDLNLFDHLT